MNNEPTLNYQAEDSPRPSVLLLAVTGILMLGCAVLIVAVMLEALDDFTVIGLIVASCVAIIIASIAFAEYFAVFKQSNGATMLVAIVFAMPILGIPRLVSGVLGLLNIRPIDREYKNWGEVGEFVAAFSLSGLISIVHFARHRRLKRDRSRGNDRRVEKLDLIE